MDVRSLREYEYVGDHSTRNAPKIIVWIVAVHNERTGNGTYFMYETSSIRSGYAMQGDYERDATAAKRAATKDLNGYKALGRWEDQGSQKL